MSNLWERIDLLIAEYPDPAWLGSQGLGGIAAWRLRQRGAPVPEAVERYERGAAFASVTAAPLLQQIVDALGEEVLVLKGPENAELYPVRTMRTYGDLDLLVSDVRTAEQTLIAAGFLSSGIDYSDMPGQHHDTPLIHPGLALAVELHRHPGWLAWSTPPSNHELFRTSVPSVTEVAGARALPPTQHLLHLMSHAWRHKPYNSLIHLIDIELLRQSVDPIELNETSDRWGLEKVVARTFAAIDRLIYGRSASETLFDKIWSRHLRQHRGQTLAEHYAGQWFKGIAAPTPTEQLEQIAADIRWSLSLHPGQSKRTKAKRIARGVISPGVRLT